MSASHGASKWLACTLILKCSDYYDSTELSACGCVGGPGAHWQTVLTALAAVTPGLQDHNCPTHGGDLLLCWRHIVQQPLLYYGKVLGT